MPSVEVTELRPSTKESVDNKKICLTKTLELKDYDKILPFREHLESAYTELSSNGIRIDLGHPHRLWEYSMALAAFLTWLAHYQNSLTQIKIVDVGAGRGLLAPTLSLMLDIGISEIEPETDNLIDRVKCNQYLRSKGRPEIVWHHGHLENFRASILWDVVFCISVVEHVPQPAERRFWKEIASRIKSEGLLFMTTDIIPVHGRSYVYDNLRNTNYTDDMLLERIGWLQEEGMTVFGDQDMKYRETNVHDYNFASIAMVKG